MRRRIVFATGVMLLAAMLTIPVASKDAGRPRCPCPIGVLLLFEKNPSTWEIVEGGACGGIVYNRWGREFAFLFSGRGLAPGEDYTLIYYPDPWPGAGLICLGSGTANACGRICIWGSVDTGDLPADYDYNHPDNYYDYIDDYPTLRLGAKIWLVLSSDVQCDDIVPRMIGWHPTEYLFEEETIFFDDTDD